MNEDHDETDDECILMLLLPFCVWLIRKYFLSFSFLEVNCVCGHVVCNENSEMCSVCNEYSCLVLLSSASHVLKERANQD